ncbi:hypothetical protein IEQ34_018506 [Dendrobium chrysotoxum]|uniref:B box-type domain-containing protein n=1 Tax=Dendrobium chrysotoxum TaxID=161865 RepID=A0AAV7G633_DENCH|nr:hypothetical protein IEQ34_018506 [Dendrobium chrysotoxum]
MKILCDVCGAKEAAVFCCADEAALCSECDHRVHRANKLADKHTRLSLLSSSPQPHHLCDICQERRGFVFCKEERAILCHECDSSIHATKGLTMMHSRFILTGIRISSTSIPASSLEQSISKKKVSEPFSPPMAECSNSSSISEYLTKMLPGYLFEDFLFDESIHYTAGDIFYQSDALALLVEADPDTSNIEVASAADRVFSVPDAPLHIHHATSIILAAATATSVESLNKETSRTHHLASPAAAPVASQGIEHWTTEEVFIVPQLPSVPGSNKRPFRASA